MPRKITVSSDSEYLTDKYRRALAVISISDKSQLLWLEILHDYRAVKRLCQTLRLAPVALAVYWCDLGLPVPYTLEDANSLDLEMRIYGESLHSQDPEAIIPALVREFCSRQYLKTGGHTTVHTPCVQSGNSGHVIHSSPQKAGFLPTRRRGHGYKVGVVPISVPSQFP